MCGVCGAVSCWFLPEGGEAAVPLLRAGSQHPNAERGCEGTSHLQDDSSDPGESVVFLQSVRETGGKGKRLQLGSFLIAFGLQVHAEIEFELLEGAELALKTLNGLNVQGQAIKVTPPIVFCSFRSG